MGQHHLRVADDRRGCGGGNDREDYVANFGFLIIGVLIGTYPVFLIEELRRAREKRILTESLYHELANRVARCCFDFESPWSRYWTQLDSTTEFWLRKFIPEPPVIYPAVASNISVLGAGAARTVIEFYIALAAWERDITNTADESSRRSELVRHYELVS